jgi:hypothetical protein
MAIRLEVAVGDGLVGVVHRDENCAILLTPLNIAREVRRTRTPSYHLFERVVPEASFAH